MLATEAPTAVNKNAPQEKTLWMVMDPKTAETAQDEEFATTLKDSAIVSRASSEPDATTKAPSNKRNGSFLVQIKRTKTTSSIVLKKHIFA